MARNGSGTQTVPNTFVAGTAITASDHNENWTDAAAEITNSLALDGQSTMTGQLKSASGTVAAPGIAFASEPDCGLYRIGANNLGVGVNGAKVLDISTAGLGVTGDVDATIVKQGTFRLVPAGAIMSYGGAAAPGGWLLCYGQAISRTTYADLFAAIGTTYGVGDASTTFNVPDIRGRVVAGQDDMGGSSANRLTGLTGGVDGDVLGGTGGAESVTLDVTMIPAITPTGTVTVNEPAAQEARNLLNDGTDSSITIVRSYTANATKTLSINSFGGGLAHNNVQPVIVLNSIIKT